MSTYYGSPDSNVLNSSNWNYSWTSFYMNDGNDRVVTPNTGGRYKFYGGEGNDYFFGDTANDQAYGGNDNDTLLGDRGNDTLSGDYGNDTLSGGVGSDGLYGGYGRDHLYGGTGSDTLYGGYGTDTFHISRGESNAANGLADNIRDWNVRYDYIDSPIRGSTGNYREATTNVYNIDDARDQVEASPTLKVADHVFLYNRTTDTGFLLSDLNRNYIFETGVVIAGAGSAADMSHSDII